MRLEQQHQRRENLKRGLEHSLDGRDSVLEERHAEVLADAGDERRGGAERRPGLRQHLQEQLQRQHLALHVYSLVRLDPRIHQVELHRQPAEARKDFEDIFRLNCQFLLLPLPPLAGLLHRGRSGLHALHHGRHHLRERPLRRRLVRRAVASEVDVAACAHALQQRPPVHVARLRQHRRLQEPHNLHLDELVREAPAAAHPRDHHVHRLLWGLRFVVHLFGLRVRGEVDVPADEPVREDLVEPLERLLDDAGVLRRQRLEEGERHLDPQLGRSGRRASGASGGLGRGEGGDHALTGGADRIQVSVAAPPRRQRAQQLRERGMGDLAWRRLGARPVCPVRHMFFRGRHRASVHT
mmetsp:Transcript_57543/g.136932  ORF Transcript_57543/g.136932 Transcript_57543/m.136932 type:complete len:353 (-) Transcript_57543:112-1170(-)